MQSSQTIDTLKNRLPMMQNIDSCGGGTNRISPMDVQDPSASEGGDPRKCSRMNHIKQKVYSGNIYYCLVVMLIISTIFNLFFKLFRTIKAEFLARIFEFLFFESLLAILSFLAFKRTSLIHFNSLSVSKSKLLHRILLVFMVVIIFATHFSPIFSVVPLPDDEWITTSCYLAFGFWIHYGAFLFILILVECFSTLVLWLKTKWSWKALHSIVPVIRQPFFTSENMHTIVALLLALFFTLEGFYSTTSKPTIKNLNIKITDLPSEFENFSIAMVSDIHAGPSVGKQRVFEIVETVNALNPDAIAIVGDFVDGYIKNMANRIEPFKHFHAKYGVYGALGNHDYFFEPVDNWITYFGEELKIKMLVNDAVVLKRGGKELCFVGTDDLLADFLNVRGHTLDVEQALSQCPTNISTIVMAHQPNGAAKVLREITRSNRKVDLILSGHTHAGQMFITLPFGYLFNLYFFGHYFYAPTNTQIYVSSGINYWGPPLKMLPSLCEIVNIKLLKG